MRQAMKLGALLVGLCMATAVQAAPSVSISVAPATGIAPYQATLTWGATGATSCTASDAWTGPQPTSGTKQVTISAATKFTLTCVASDGQVTISWVPPTSNTDGSPLTDLAGFNVYRGTSATNLARVKSVGTAVTSTIDSGLASGTYIYSATAVNAASLESAKGNTSSAVVVGSSATQSAQAIVQTTPSPPTGIVTSAATAYEIRLSSGVLTATRIGVIPLGSPCQTDTRLVGTVVYNRVAPSAVDLINWPNAIPPVDVFARCTTG
jgi:hypothetical protein